MTRETYQNRLDGIQQIAQETGHSPAAVQIACDNLIDWSHPDAVSKGVGIVLRRLQSVRWKGKYSDYLRTAWWRLHRDLVKKACYGKCVLCSSKEKLHVHHNRYRDEHGSILCREQPIRDTVLLCGECHTHHHAEDN